ncbi:MAG: hypothetical protein GX044_01300 [Firmicutes bacterium]|jgi:hypothetical protein|nr:hypothetical protein [Bacillota bacterium]
MKRLEKICIFILLAVMFTIIFPGTAMAGVIGDPGGGYGTSAALVYSELTNLDSTKLEKAYAWGYAPSDYTATLSPETGYTLPPSITVQKVKYYDSENDEPIVPVVVEKTYTAGSDYTYDQSTGEIVIPIETLNEIVYDQSPYHIRITAAGVLNTTTYTIAVTQSANGTITPAVADNIPHGSDFTFTISPDSGYRIADVVADGISVGAVSTYTFTNIISSDHTITALFEEDTQSSSDTQPHKDDASKDDGSNDILPKTGSRSLSWIWPLLCGILVAGIAVRAVIQRTAPSNR